MNQIIRDQEMPASVMTDPRDHFHDTAAQSKRLGPSLPQGRSCVVSTLGLVSIAPHRDECGANQATHLRRST
jgi:hypothetical protein